VISVWVSVLLIILLLVGGSFLVSKNFNQKNRDHGKFESAENLKVYQCPACNYKFTEADQNWYSILYTDHCPSCGKWLPDGLLDKFCCASCGKIKDIAELGRVHRLANFALNCLPAPKMKHICSKCRVSANILGWFFLIAAILFVYVSLFGNHAS